MIIFFIDSTEDYCLNQLIGIYNVTSVYFAVKQRKVANLHIVEAGIRENLALFLENDNNLIVEITVEAFSSTAEVLNCVCLFVCCLRITQELLTGFPPNLDGGCVSTQNRPRSLLVQIRIEGQIQEYFFSFFNIEDGAYFNIVIFFFIPTPKQSTSTTL